MRDINRPNDSSTEISRYSDVDDGDRDPVEELAAEFADRVRDGERVSIEQYALMHPELAAEIRDLFPMVETMEQINAKRVMSTGGQYSMPSQLGDYRIVGEIARGGMGIIYEAEQVSLGRRVAVKMLPAHALRRERDVRRFEREALTAANLHHSNIVPVFGVGEENGQRYIVMQLIRGVGLDEVLHQVRSFVAERDFAEPTVTTERLSTAVRSAASLLDSQLKLNSTIVDANAETVETPLREAGFTPKKFSPLKMRNPMGEDYFKNVASIGLQAAQALQYAHQNNTLHRDIKPGNLLLDDAGRIWIADFGLAKALQDDDVTCSGDLVGTLAYVAPERFQGTTTKLSDIYSLGVTLHEMLTLQKAFEGEDRVAIMNQVANQGLPNPRALNKTVPRDLETIVMKAASSQPGDRYRTAKEMAFDLEAFIEDRPIAARRLSYVEHAVRWCRRNRGMTSLAATVVLLLATLFGMLAFGYRHADRQRERFEATSQLAVGALDEIYYGFASTSLSESLADDMNTEDSELVHSAQMPISKDVVLLLDRLLQFYDELSMQSDDSNAVSIKYIAANRRVGDINRRLGRSGDARTSYDETIARIEKLPEELRETESMRIEAARAHNGTGLTLRFDWRHAQDRVKSHNSAVAILDHPDATDRELFELATSLYLLHVSELRRSSRSRSRGSDASNATRNSNLDRALRLLCSLKQRNSDRAEYDLLLARCYVAKSDRGRTATNSIGETQAQAIQILEALIQRYPENPDYRYELGHLYRTIERYLKFEHHRSRKLEDLLESETRLRKALDVTGDLEVEHPNIPKHYLLKKELHEYMGIVLSKQHKLPEAISHYEQSIKMQRLLVRKSERPEVHRPWLFRLQLSYGKLLRDAEQYDAAKRSLMRTARNLEALVAQTDQHPDGPDQVRDRYQKDNRRTLEKTYLALAKVLETLGEPESAASMIEKAEKASW